MMNLKSLRNRKNKKKVLIKGIAMTDRGCIRQINEDAVELIMPDINDRHSGKGILAILADGMGGHLAGEVASEMAVETINEVYYQHQGCPEESLKNAFKAANEKIWMQSQDFLACKGMGNTCSVVVLVEDKLLLAHVGDSRIYHCHDQQIKQLSTDHTLAADLDAQGISTKQNQLHVLTKAMGIHQTVEFQFEIKSPVCRQDRYLICSDGLHDLIDDKEINALVSMNPLSLAAQSMIALAKHRGGYDNISVIILEAH
ncbi:MAG: serine/threonine-protein phosphatase [Saprospiraceae bacterium]|nr:serine/threonine-protein phosphatase [Saprospiraceae bacterium]